MSNNRPSFLLYKSFYAPLKHLKDDELGLLFRALFDYQNGLEIKNLPPQIGMAFAFFKNQFDLDDQKYQVVLERNKSNGSKGGRPKKEETQANPENPVGFYEPRKGEKEKEKEIEKDIEKKINKKPKGFIAPSLQEVQDYCKSRGNSVSPKGFLDYYVAGDWKDKDGKAVKNWKQKVLSWENRNSNEKPITPSNPLIEKLNSIAGKNLFSKTEISYDQVLLRCHDVVLSKEAKQLPVETKEKIKEEILKSFPDKTLTVTY